MSGDTQLSSAGVLGAEEAAHALDTMVFVVEAVLGGRLGACSEEGICTGGTDTELPKSILHSTSDSTFLPSPDVSPLPGALTVELWSFPN